MCSGYYITFISRCQKIYYNDSKITEFEMIDTKK